MTFRLLFVALLLAPIGLAGCAMIEQTLALRQVNFAIDDVNQLRLAGANIDNVQSYEQLGPAAAAGIASALATGRLPLSFTMHIGAENPSENTVAARLMRLDWTLLLDDTETISGLFEDERLIEPGTRETLSMGMQLDLLEFFDRNLPALFDLALAIGGHGSQEVALRARPTVTTAFGPITYPGYITIRHTVGS